MTTLQKTVVAATLVAAVGSGVYANRENSRLRNEVELLRHTQAALDAETAELKAENARLSSAAAAKQPTSLPDEQFHELLRLRGKAQLNAREIAELRSAIAQNSGKIPEPVAEIMNGFLTSAVEQAKQAQKNSALGKLNRMSRKIDLDPEQQQQVRDVFLAHAERRAEMEMAHATGTLFLDNNTTREKITEDENLALTGVLSPEQMAAYEQWKADETAASDRAWVAYEKASMRRALNLTTEQADQVSTALSSLKRGEGGPGITYYANTQEQLETRLRAFAPILTEQQLQNYRRMKMEGLEEKAEFAEIVMALKRSGQGQLAPPGK